MIRTKDLVEFIEGIQTTYYIKHDLRECCLEIVARLRAFDKLKESIEKLCRRLSNEVDK